MRVSKHCFAVTGLGFTPPWEVNDGFIQGDRRTLVVDTGPTALAARTVYGYARAAGPDNAMLAVNTEMHVDHLMGNSFFHDMSVPLWGHVTCERSADALEANAAEYNATIPDEARRGRFEASVFFWETRIVNPENRISAETLFDLGAIEARIIPAPGHTPANMLIWVPADAVLYTGDTVVSRYAPNLESGGPDDWRRWVVALALVRSLRPAILVPGHGPVVEGAEIAREIDRIEAELRGAIARA